MKSLKHTSLAIVVNLMLSGGIMAGNGPGNGYGNEQLNDTAPVGQQTWQSDLASAANADTSIALTETEQLNLLFMREEEKLARDVYWYFYNLWGANIFSNIYKSEQNHMDIVKLLLDAYNLTDPAPVDKGFFTDPELQNLYDELIVRGSSSLIEALKVGVLIEEIDIKDLYQSINETDNPAIIQAYTQLLNGSYKHLNAFVSQLSSLGVSYEAEELSSDEVDSILSGEEFNADVIDGLAIDRHHKAVKTQTRFSHTVSVNSAVSGNNIEISDDQPVRLSSHVIADLEDIGQKVNYLAILHYQSIVGKDHFLTKTGQQWRGWDGAPGNIGYAESHTLREVQQFTVFQGELNNLPGTFHFYTGYHLPNGKIVLGKEPISVKVK